MTINIMPEIEEKFDYLYKYLPSEIVTKVIEEDINTMLKMFFDNKFYIDPIQINNVGWMKSKS